MSNDVRVDAMGFDVNTFCIEFSHSVIDLMFDSIEVSLSVCLNWRQSSLKVWVSDGLTAHFPSISICHSFDWINWSQNMVKLYYISILYKNENNRVNNLKSASDLTSFGYFQRNRYSFKWLVYWFLICYQYFCNYLMIYLKCRRIHEIYVKSMRREVRQGHPFFGQTAGYVSTTNKLIKILLNF